MSQEKPNLPTPKRLKDARKEGQVVKSPILSGACATLGCGLGLGLALHLSWVRTVLLLEYSLLYGSQHLSVILALWGECLLLMVTLPLGLAMLMALLAETLQVGFEVHWSILSLKFSRLDMFAGCRKVFGGLKQSWFHLFGFTFVFGTLLIFFSGNWSTIFRVVLLASASLDLNVLHAWVSDSMLSLWLAGVASAMCVGVLDYMLRRKKFLREVSMTHDELRREFKEQDGDPMLQSQRRSLHEALLSQDLVKRVRSSKVIMVEREN